MGYWQGMAFLKAPLIAFAGFLLLAVVTLSPKQRPADQLGTLAVAAQPTTNNEQSTTVTPLPPLQARTLSALSSAPTPSQLRSAIEAYFIQGLLPSLASQLKGPKGDKGDSGLPGQAGIQGPSGYSIGAVYPTATYPTAGTLGGVTYFGAKEITTQTLTATGATTLASLNVSGGASAASLTVSGATSLASLLVANASISNDFEVSGTASVSQLFIAGTAFSPASAGGWTDDGSVVRLTTAGDNVGIGTANVSSKLEVAGTASISGQLSLWNSASVSANLEVAGYASVSNTLAP
jgi:hypothetical protein